MRDMEWFSVSTYGCSVLTYLALQMVFACLEHRRQKRRTAEGMGHGAEGTQHGDRDRGEWPLGESHSCATVRQDPSAPRRWLPGESHTCASVGEPPTSHRQCPSVTVVLPTFNEPVANLRACVHSVLNQSYPGRIQVVVVDDGSDEPVSEASLGLSCASTAGDTEIAAAIAGPPNSKSESACGGRNPKPIQDPNPQMLKTTDSWFGASAGSGLTATKDGNCEIASSRNSGTRNDDFCTQDEWKEHETGPILWPEGGSPVQSQIRLRGRRSTATAHESVASPESQMPFSPGHVQIQTVGMPSSRASGVHRLADGLAVTSHCTPEGSQSERLPRNRRCEVLVLPENRGKRHAQKAAFDRAEGEYIVTADGDTVLHPDALIALVQAMEPWSDAGVARGMGTGDHPGLPEVRDGLARVGAATASIRVRNTNSLFTTLLELRYWCAGHQERASQSYFGVMVCCS
ncbi:MAG: glycosyltransferase, partial [Planctomycetes bacterium]|nr:glycosyltransferase [Planctomycetota bacterium]